MTWTAKQQAVYDRATRHRRGYHNFMFRNGAGAVAECVVCGGKEDTSNWEKNGWALARKHAHIPRSLQIIRLAFFLFRVLAAPLIIFLGMCDGIPPARMWRRFNAAAAQLETRDDLG